VCMLCRLAVRRIVSSDEDQTEYVLRVAGEPILGSAGALGSDERSFLGQDELLACLRFLGVSEPTLKQFTVTAQQPASAFRFVVFAEKEHIGFERLQDADLDIFID
jgi:hypothetical protein